MKLIILSLPPQTTLLFIYLILSCALAATRFNNSCSYSCYCYRSFCYAESRWYLKLNEQMCYPANVSFQGKVNTCLFACCTLLGKKKGKKRKIIVVAVTAVAAACMIAPSPTLKGTLTCPYSKALSHTNTHIRLHRRIYALTCNKGTCRCDS